MALGCELRRWTGTQSDDRFWRKADITTLPIHVRFWGKADIIQSRSDVRF
jgi:hypothetical protein